MSEEKALMAGKLCVQILEQTIEGLKRKLESSQAREALLIQAIEAAHELAAKHDVALEYGFAAVLALPVNDDALQERLAAERTWCALMLRDRVAYKLSPDSPHRKLVEEVIDELRGDQ